MRFPNAYAGVSKIRTAQILSVIVTVILLLAAVLGLVLLQTDLENPGGSTLLLAGGVTILALVSGILGIISLILNIVGINRASKDESTFNLALAVVIVNILVAAVNTAVPGESGLSDILDLVSTVAQALTAIFVIRGVTNLADQLGDGEMVEQGGRTQTLVLILCAAGLVLRAAADYFLDPSSLAANVLLLVSSLFSLAQFVVYLLYLNRARQLLV